MAGRRRAPNAPKSSTWPRQRRHASIPRSSANAAARMRSAAGPEGHGPGSNMLGPPSSDGGAHGAGESRPWCVRFTGRVAGVQAVAQERRRQDDAADAGAVTARHPIEILGVGHLLVEWADEIER